jgi:hypothetical protein
VKALCAIRDSRTTMASERGGSERAPRRCQAPHAERKKTVGIFPCASSAYHR